MNYTCNLECKSPFEWETDITLPSKEFVCEIRYDEFGLFEVWNDCHGEGLLFTYTSWAWETGDRTDGLKNCVNNATDVIMGTKGTHLGNRNMCDLKIKVKSSYFGSPCMKFKVLHSKMAFRLGS